MSVRFQETVQCERCRCAIDMSPGRAEELAEMHVEVLCNGCKRDDFERCQE